MMTDEQKARILQLHAMGMGYTAIGKEMGIKLTHDQMRFLRQKNRSGSQTKAQAVLQRSMPHEVVEQPPGGNQPKGLPHLHLQLLRKGIYGLWEKGRKVLLGRMLR